MDLVTTLERFDEADVALLESRALLRRVDSKFVVGESELGAILEPVAGDYGLVLAGGNRLATYRTAYFDTPERTCYHDHRRGRRPRQKVRIRHYDDRSVSFLEIKTKRSEFMSAKQRRPRPFNDSSLSSEAREYIASNSRLPGGDLEPAARTDFQRATLVGLHTNERITIDVNLVISSDNNPPVALRGVAILEVKQERFSNRSPIMQSLRARGHRPASASKYCTATALLNPTLRRNRLLPALRTIERLRK